MTSILLCIYLNLNGIIEEIIDHELFFLFILNNEKHSILFHLLEFPHIQIFKTHFHYYYSMIWRMKKFVVIKLFDRLYFFIIDRKYINITNLLQHLHEINHTYTHRRRTSLLSVANDETVEI